MLICYTDAYFLITKKIVMEKIATKCNTTNIRYFSVLIFILIFALNGDSWGQQVIGEFPSQDGGFEGQTAGAIGTTSSATAWWASLAGIGNIYSSGGRSGPYYSNLTMSGSTHRTLRGPTAANIAAGTNYQIQFFYKGDNNNDGTADYGDIRGGVSGSTYQYDAYVTNQNQASWTKYQGVTPANPGASASGFAVVSVLEIAGKTGNFDIDDIVIYAGAVDNTAPNSPGAVTVNNPTPSTLDVSWVAATGGVDGGGYVVVRYATSPNADNDPNQNGIYAVGNTHTNGTGSLTGTIRYIGTGLSFIDNSGLSAGTQYWYKVYTVDKAFNYSSESSGNGTTTGGGNDTDSKVEAPASQISAGDIASTVTASGSAVSVFSFKLKDLGTSDGLATKVTQVKIKKSSGTADWTDHIAGASLWDGGSQITTGAVTITDNDITFPITSGNLDISNNSNKDITLKIWLNTTNIVDNSTMVFTVSQTSHEFTADVTGSTFASDFGTAVTGNTMTVRVTATKLLFVQQPSNTVVNVAMTPNPTVKACDANNNIDTDYSTAVSVTSSGTLSGTPVSGTWSSGVATFSNLTHTATGAGLTLTASSTGITNAVSSTFDITDVPSSCASDLIISEYAEGTSGNSKYIEIYNFTGSTITLSNYRLWLVTNGGTWPESTYDFTTPTLADGATLVIANNATDVPGADEYNASICGFNGNDAIGLAKNTGTWNLIDGIGTDGADPGTGWDVAGTTNATANYKLTRKATITSPQAVWATSAGTDASNSGWIVGAYSTGSASAGHSMTCCTPPSTQASATSTNTPTVDGFSISWTAGNGDGTMIVIRPTAQANTLPSSGTSYTANLAWGSAGQIDANNRVVYKASGTSAGPVTGLTAETQYTITAYEYSNTGPCYNTTSPISTTRYTLSTEPTAQPGSGFSATTCTANSIDLTIPAPSTGADGFIVLQKAGSAPTGLPTDGVSYNPGDAVGDATVATSVTSSGSYTITGLSASTNYYYIIIPYNANATSIAQTYNYYTGGTLLQTNFSTLATGASSSSTVETDGTYSYTQNIAYANYQSTPVPASTASSVGVHNIIIKDGGGSSDADAFETILTAISYSYTGTANTVRAAALFTTSNSKIAEASSTGANSITFTGLSGANVTAPDNGNIELILRVTFNSTVTDNEKLVFTVTSVTGGSNCSYSQFANADGGGAFSDNTGDDDNRIEVTADRLIFSQQPSNTSINMAMSPNPTVSAVDANGCVDKDFSTAISVSSDGTMTGDPVSGTWSNGVATFSSLTHTVAGTGLILTATSSGLAFSNSVVSNSYNITEIIYNNNDWRSLSSGTWKTDGTGTSTWERMVSGSWVTQAGDPPTNTSNTIYIANSHTVSSTSFGSSVNLKILEGGTFSVLGSSTTASIYIYVGGTLYVEAALQNNGNFDVEDNGNVILQNYLFTNNSTIWNGTENFQPNSNFIIKEWGANNATTSYRPVFNGTNISTNTYNGYTAAFGNIEIDLSTSTEPNTFVLISGGVSANLAHGDISFKNPNSIGNNISVKSSGNVVSGIGGDFIVDNFYSAAQTVMFANSSGTVDFSIKGNMQLDGATTVLTTSTTAGAYSTVNIDGNINVTAGAVLNFSGSVSVNPAATINLKGDLIVAGSGVLQNSNTSIFGQFNFVGTGDGLTDETTQTIDIATTSATLENRYIYFNIKNGSYVKQINRDFELGTNSKVNVESGGIFDFGFGSGDTPLLTKLSGAMTGGSFDLQQGGILKITSPDGIIKNTTTYGLNTGNIQGIVQTNRNYTQLATYWYIGRANQVTGDGINQTLASSGFGKQVICELANNTISLVPTVSFALTNDATISGTGGKLDIRKGKFIETETEYITGTSGTLYMSPGTLYRIFKGNNSFVTTDDIPRMTGSSYSYVLSGGTIELAGSGANAFQRLRSDNSNYNYQYVKYSGANTYGIDYKNLNDQTTIDSALIITGTAVVDCIQTDAGVASSFVGNGGVIMDGGRLRIKKRTTVNPELTGVNVPYTLTGGTIEFYGTSSLGNQQQIRGNYGSGPTKVSYYNIDIKADEAKYGSDVASAGNVDMNSSFLLKNILTVYSPAVFRMDATEDISDASSPEGTQAININAGAGLLYGSSNGIKTSGTGVNDGNIRISGTRSLSDAASYGFVGSSANMVSGDGIPSTVYGLYAYRTAFANSVTMSKAVTITNKLNLITGRIITTSTNILNVADNATSDPGSAISFIDGPLKKIGNDAFVFPMGNTDKWARIGISAPTNNTTEYTAQYYKVGYSDTTTIHSPQLIHYISALEYWTLDQAVNNDDVVVKLFWEDASWSGINDCDGTPDDLRIAHFNGTDWELNIDEAVITCNATTGDISTTTQQPEFSPFTFASKSKSFSTNPLPIELISFTAEYYKPNVELNWITSAEINNDFFTLEKSKDCITFIPFEKINGAGNSNSIINYNSYDNNPYKGISYYRLKQTDFDGKYTYSNSVSVYVPSNDICNTWYNKNENSVFISFNSEIENNYLIRIFDITGKEVFKKETFISGKVKLCTAKNILSSGVYIISIESEFDRISERIIVN